ncbi:MIT C-terminal domain-containing protein [Thiolapillus sp.]|uniref:MIT C-terminal domain-containing protein n=1 Tax=Thiolapillus sp. TaxID=2017437 RepID=UPI003AF9E96C
MYFKTFWGRDQHLIWGNLFFPRPLQKIQEAAAPIGINFSWEFSKDEGLHARHIVTDTGWKILLDRGLDIFQRYEMSDAFSFSNRLQEYRPCKAFEVTYLQ